jgi:hypothetical protein
VLLNAYIITVSIAIFYSGKVLITSQFRGFIGFRKFRNPLTFFKNVYVSSQIKIHQFFAVVDLPCPGVCVGG